MAGDVTTFKKSVLLVVHSDDNDDDERIDHLVGC